MTEQVKNLIERLEKATGPDRELDVAIFRAIGAPLPSKFATLPVRLEWDEKEQSFMTNVGEGMRVRFDPSPYTDSLDAAMTLVPEGWIWDVTSTGCAWTMPDGAIGWHVSISGPRSPALALCIVALKARVHLRDASEQKADSAADGQQ